MGWLGATNRIACGVVVRRNVNPPPFYEGIEAPDLKIATNRTTADDTVSRSEKIKPTNQLASLSWLGGISDHPPSNLPYSHPAAKSRLTVMLVVILLGATNCPKTVKND